MKTKLIIMAIAMATALWSCSDDETNGTARLGVNFNTVTTSNSNQRVLTNGIEFTSGFITISEIEFEASSDNDLMTADFELDQVVKIDFATGETTPNINAISIPAGTYEEVEVDLELYDDGETPGTVIEGTFTYNDETHPVRFEFNSGESFEVEKEGNVVFTDGMSAIAQVTFDPYAWFATVTADQMAAAVIDEEGVIVISTTQNSNIYQIVATGLDFASDVEIEY